MLDYFKTLIVVLMTLTLTSGSAWAKRPFKDVTIIEVGGSTPDTIYLGKNVDALELLGFDGAGYWIARPDLRLEGVGDLHRTGASTPETLINERVFFPWPKGEVVPSDLSDSITDMQPTKDSMFNKNYPFLYMCNDGDMNWFDDDRWANAIKNAKLFSRYGAASGIKGFLMDAEQYDGNVFTYTGLQAAMPEVYDGKTFAEVRAKVQQRGEEFIQAINSEMPTVSIFFMHGYHTMLKVGISTEEQLANHSMGLSAGFIDGILNGSTRYTSVVDGCSAGESHGQWAQGATRANFEAVRNMVLNDPITLGLTNVPVAYAEKMRVGFGMYMYDVYNDFDPWDPDVPANNFVTPAELQNGLDLALDVGDGYVWFWNQVQNFYLPAIDGAPTRPRPTNPPVHADYVTAINTAKDLHMGPSVRLVELKDPGIPAHHRTFDIIAETREGATLSNMNLILTAVTAGSIYQHPAGGNSEPDPALFEVDPALEFDTYVTMGEFNNPPVIISGGATDIDDGAALAFDKRKLNIRWSANDVNPGPGTFQIGRITMPNWAGAAYTVMSYQTDADGSPTIIEGFIPPARISR